MEKIARKRRLPKVRIGRLTLIAKIVRRGGGWPVAALFRCDCGRQVRLSVKRIKDKKIPEACTKCLYKIYTREYESWRHIAHDRRKGWKFHQFLEQLGPKPEGARLRKKYRDWCHSSFNSYWA